MNRLFAILCGLSLFFSLSAYAVPDLIVVGIKMDPANPKPGDNVKFTMTVENIGTATPTGQPIKGAFLVNGIKSTWTTGNGNTSPLPQYGYRDLVADGGPYNGNSPLYRWGDYTQTVTAVVNDTNLIAESNTGNNNYAKTFEAVKKPDLIVVGIKMSPENPSPGQNVTFTMTVENIGGPTTAGQPIKGAFFVNGIKSTWTTGNGNTSSLPTNGYRDLVADGGPYNGNSPLYKWGNYAQTVQAVVNDTNLIAESNSGNNSYSKSFSAAKFIYGINGHPDYPLSYADTLQALKAMGVTYYRINTGTSAESIANAAKLSAYLIQNGIKVLPVLDCGLMGNPGDEEGSFAAAYKLAVQMVLAFQGQGIKVYEVGNEIDRQSALFNNPYAAGNEPGDYNISAMPGYRSTIRGLIEGVHAAQWDAKAGINFVGADTAAAEMLWNGWQPDPKNRFAYVKGFKTARWDITMWHNYEVYLSIFDIGVDGGGRATPALNLPEWSKRYNNNPFWLTEFNANKEDSQEQKVAYMSKTLQELYDNRISGNIEAIFVYQLDGEYGFMINDRVRPIQYYPYYYTYVDFIKTHP